MGRAQVGELANLSIAIACSTLLSYVYGYRAKGWQLTS